MTQFAEVGVRWLSTSEGGRCTPVRLHRAESGGYMPHFRVDGVGEYLGVAFLLGDPAWANPGDDSRATVALVYADKGVDYSSLTPGTSFDVVEGGWVVAKGQVLRRWTDSTDGHDLPAK